MKWLLIFILAIGQMSGFSRLPETQQVAAIEHVGVRTLSYQDEERHRPVLVEIWYPTQKSSPADLPQDIWVHPLEVRDAPLSKRLKAYPLVLMSHGHGGDRRDRSWLVEPLIKNGYIVASVEHHGNSWRSYDPQESLRFWDRARDVSFALSQLLEEPHLERRVDPERIGFIGYSLGGLTGLYLAGAQAENVKESLKRQQIIIKEIDPQVIEQFDFTDAYQNFTDGRIKAFVLLSPATFVFPAESLQRVKAQIALVATEDDEILPHKEHAQQIITHLVPKKLKLLRDKISHHAFLNRITKEGKKRVASSAFAADHIESSRPKLHREVAQFAIDFLNEKLADNAAAESP